MKPYRRRRTVRWVLVLAVLAIASSGCLDAFRVSVPHAALDASPLEWEVTTFPQEGGKFGLRIKETRYVHRTGDDSSAPFPGVIQVFSLRGGNSMERAALMERAEGVLADAIDQEGITLDASKEAEGQRELRNGVRTSWTFQEGTIESGSGDFFNPQTRITVRILAEVGADGRSSTGFIAVAFVKVAELRQNPLGVGSTTVQDDATWLDVVADPEGSIRGASYASGDRGLLYNLRTHG